MDRHPQPVAEQRVGMVGANAEAEAHRDDRGDGEDAQDGDQDVQFLVEVVAHRSVGKRKGTTGTANHYKYVLSI